MPHTYTNGTKIYSVDLMLAYINLYKPEYGWVNVDTLEHYLAKKTWGTNVGWGYSPMDVISNSVKFWDEYTRIKNADLEYPIIMTKKGDIVDGVHRLAKAKLENKTQIKVYEFDKFLMRGFLLNKKEDWEYVDSLNTHDYIQLFVKRFERA